MVVRTSPEHRHIVSTAVVNGNLKHKEVQGIFAKAIIHRPIVRLRIFAKEHVIIAVNMW